MYNVLDIENPNNFSFIVESNHLINEDASIRCWAFKQWVKRQLRKASDDTELINEIAEALETLCVIAEDFDLI